MERFYGNNRFYEAGIFKGKKALLSLTVGASEDAYLKNGLHGDLYGVLKPVHRGMLRFVGFDVLRPQVVYGPVRQTAEQRERELAGWAERLKNIFTEQPIEVDAY
jgi:NAD(P)H dehydrogenase (quinone)